jgi:Na+-driven multidrug efflux pump
MAITVSFSVYMGRYSIAKVLTADPELINIVAKVILLLSLYYFPDAAQGYL